MEFNDSEIVILNEKIKNGLPMRVGELAMIYCKHKNSNNYDYTIVLDNGDLIPVKESELNRLTERQNELIEYIKKGNSVLYSPIDEKVKITKVDYLNEQAEIDFISGGSTVIGFDLLTQLNEEIDSVKETNKLGKFTDIALAIGKFTDKKNKQYGSSVDATYEMIKVLMERYENDDNTYTIPESLLPHLLLQVRMMDKQNRIFNNPSGEGDSESPYNDLAGYSLIGIDMVESVK